MEPSKPTSKDALAGELATAGRQPVDEVAFLSGVLAGCGDCIKILDLDGRLQFMSEGGKRVMEVEDFGALKGCNWPDFWAGAGNADAGNAVEAARAGRSYRFRGPANTAKGNAKYWDVQVSPIAGADGRPTHILSISRDISAEWTAAERQRFLTDELQHRVKNTLANVMSIAGQTFRGDAHRVPLAVFNERVVTLDRMHDVLTGSNWDSTSVQKVMETALGSHEWFSGAVRLQGPEVMLAPRLALALALASNELATNAVKYGARSVAGGRIDVAWSLSPDLETFRWTWTEHGGPAVAQPSRTGFGSRMIRDMLSDEFGGESDLSFAPDGLVVTLSAPAAALNPAE